MKKLINAIEYLPDWLGIFKVGLQTIARNFFDPYRTLHTHRGKIDLTPVLFTYDLVADPGFSNAQL